MRRQEANTILGSLVASTSDQQRQAILDRLDANDTNDVIAAALTALPESPLKAIRELFNLSVIEFNQATQDPSVADAFKQYLEAQEQVRLEQTQAIASDANATAASRLAAIKQLSQADDTEATQSDSNASGVSLGSFMEAHELRATYEAERCRLLVNHAIHHGLDQETHIMSEAPELISRFYTYQSKANR